MAVDYSSRNASETQAKQRQRDLGTLCTLIISCNTCKYLDAGWVWCNTQRYQHIIHFGKTNVWKTATQKIKHDSCHFHINTLILNYLIKLYMKQINMKLAFLFEQRRNPHHTKPVNIVKKALLTGLHHKLTLSMWKQALCVWNNYKHAMVLFHHICANTAPLGQSFQQHLTTVSYTRSATVMPYLCKKIQECEGSQTQVQALVTDCASHYVKHLTGPQCTGLKIQMCMH